MCRRIRFALLLVPFGFLSFSGSASAQSSTSFAASVEDNTVLRENEFVEIGTSSPVSACDSCACNVSIGPRTQLSGDWNGLRTSWADRGISFDLFATQFFQGVAAGGSEQQFEYGGKVDCFANLDGGKLGLQEGFFVDLRAETRFGNDVNNIDGLLAPSNLPMYFPSSESHVTSITGLKVTQALSENFAIFAGKINTLSEFPLRFSSGVENNAPGLDGFMNTSLVFNPILGRTVPYSAAGCGFAILADVQPLFSLSIFDPQERVTSGFEDLFNRGVVIVPDLLLRSNFMNLPNLLNLGGSYSNSQYTSFDPAAYLDLPLTLSSNVVSLPRETGSWALYSNGYQALRVSPYDAQRNWGVFFGLGISDGNPNPVRHTAAIGIGGSSLIPQRTLDSFGVGYFHLGMSDQFKQLSQVIIPQRDEEGVEMFYNYAIKQWARLTGDVQFVRPSTLAFEDSIVVGLRLQVVL